MPNWLKALYVVAAVIFLVSFVVGVSSAMSAFRSLNNDQLATAQFRLLTGTYQVNIIAKSNDNLWSGNADDVSYHLTINGLPAMGRCIFSPLPVICRVDSEQ